MKPYLYLKGLQDAVRKLRGDENVHLGIRPYGFHGGNVLSLIVYPYLLCYELEKLDKIARFNFTISINDYEQDELDGPDIRKNPFNIYPKNTSLQFTKKNHKNDTYVVEHWQPIIERCFIDSIKKSFKNIKVSFVRNSSLKDKSDFRKLLVETLKNPKKQSKIFAQHSGKEVLDSPIRYAGVVCPQCKKTNGQSTVTKKGIQWSCVSCGLNEVRKYEHFDYWWYHKPMLVSRLKIFKTDITMSGGDHYSEGDYNIRRCFMKTYFKNFKEPIMIFCPTLIALDKQKMSKSRMNTEFIDAKKLLALAKVFYGSEILVTRDLIKKVRHEKNYRCIL